MSVTSVGMAKKLRSAKIIPYSDSSMTVSGYLDFLHGSPGYLKKVSLEKGSRSCHTLLPETGTWSFLPYSIGQAVIEHRVKEQKHIFYLLMGGVPPFLIYDKFYELGTLILILQMKKPNLERSSNLPKVIH